MVQPTRNRIRLRAPRPGRPGRLPRVPADWLDLRAGADARARSADLGALAAALAGPEPVAHDLGSGTGAMQRWLAPRLADGQRWVLHDADAGLLDTAVARAPGVPTATSVAPLDALRPADLAGATLVTASALLDVLTLGELEAVLGSVHAAGAPVLLTLSVTGRVDLEPAEPLDGRLQRAFNDHQRRTLHGRRLLGPDAVLLAEGLLAGTGWAVRSAETPWRLGAADADLAAGWLRGWLTAALEQRPALAVAAEGYRRRREAQLAAGVLRVTVHHRDLLAWPA